MKNKIQLRFFLLAVIAVSFFIMAKSVSAESSIISLPKTGQIKCYDIVGNEISCAGTGQDGEIQAGVDWPSDRFEDAGDETVTDNLTGLVWTKDAGTPVVGECNAGNMTWQDTLDYVKCLNKHAYLGYSDWRLPNVNELDSLVNLQEQDPAKWLDDQGFINVQLWYWSSTTRAIPNTGSAWVLFLREGGSYISGKGNIEYAWPVRAGQFSFPDANYRANIGKTGQKESFYPGDDGDIQAGVDWPSDRFEDAGDETVTDNLTGLIWTKDASAPIVGECNAGDMTWQGSLDYIHCLNSNTYLGHSDWRLPNKKELDSLVDFSQYGPSLPVGNPFINLRLFEGYFYLSSNSYGSDKRFVYFKSYDEGSGGGTWKDNRFGMKFLVWPVRGGIVQASPPSSGYSSVMFLPGLEGSRLYKEDASGEDQLWEPTNRNEDVKQLYLNSDGESLNDGIYTRDVVDEIYGFADNIYKGYMESMDQLVSDGIINEWKPIPYDWRLSLEKIADDGVKLENGGHMDIIEELKRMATESKTEKVTLIGHSNGGLLAKVLIDRLKESGNEKLVDKLIMVGTPQLGTPKTIAGLLHGDEINLLHGLILDKKTARGFAENMTSAYNLIPSQEYFNTVQSPVIEFDEDVKNIYDFRSLYGDKIDNWNEFKKFLLGDNGQRSEPAESDLDSPNVLKEALFNKADTTHNELDSWQAPEGMEVIQIAGWGLDTIRGIGYDDCDIPFCPDKLSNLDRSLLITQDGDETVVTPSAVEMGGNAGRYYVDLKLYNSFGKFQINRDHSDILEIKSVQDFIKNIIRGDKTLADYISTEKPEVKDEDKRLRFRLHSPVSIDLYDQDGNHTGLIENSDSSSDLQLYEEQIPNSYYWEVGERKYAGSGSSTDVVLTGEDLGTFTFDIDQITGDKVTKTTTFSNVPVTKDMKATLSVSDTVSEMKIDVDDDGKEDAVIQAGEEMKEEDLLLIFEKIIDSLDINKAVKNSLANKIKIAQKQMERNHRIAANAILEAAKWEIQIFSRKPTPNKLRIPEEEAEKLVGIIERIQTME